MDVNTQRMRENYITRSEVQQVMGYGRKPLCPRCGNPLSIVSEGATGLANMKCAKCKKPSIVDLHTLMAIEIVEDRELNKQQ